MLGAPDFMLACIPVVGQFWKKSATDFLDAANEEIEERFKNEDKFRLHCTTDEALIWSKIYRLTGDSMFKDWIKNIDLDDDEQDKNQLTRIAKHLGFKKIDEFYEFCRSR